MEALPGNGANGNGRPAGAEVFREVNKRIRELAGRRGGTDSWEFICECDDLQCTELVVMTLVEYDARRNGASSPILAHH
jgi:hypothetical protein